MGRFAIPTFLTIFMVMTLGNLDLILVRHFCSPEESGLYATATILGRVALFLPGALIFVLFPEAVKGQENNSSEGHKLLVTLGITAVLAGGVILACFFWGTLIIGTLWGSNYNTAAPLLRIISASMGLLAVSNVLFTYHLARSHYSYLWPLGGGLLIMVVSIFFMHDSSQIIAWIVLASLSIITLATLGMTYYQFSTQSRNTINP